MSRDVGRSGAGAPSGLRPSGAEPAAQSQAEPLVPKADGRLSPLEALEPFAAMGRMMRRSLLLSGGKATDDTKVLSLNSEAGICVLTYGHFIDALEAFPGDPRGWGGMYRRPASGIEAATAGETRSGSTGGESPVPAEERADAQTTAQPLSEGQP